MKLIIQLLLAAIVGAILMFVLYDPACEQSGPSQADYETMQGAYKAVIHDNFEYRRREDSLQGVIKHRDSVEQAFKRDIANYKVGLKDSAQKIKALAMQVLELALSGEKDSLCDELASQVLVINKQYVELLAQYDALVVYSDTTKYVMNRANNELHTANNLLTAEYNKLYMLYNSLLADQAALQKSLRRQKLKTKIAAVLGVIGTGAALLK